MPAGRADLAPSPSTCRQEGSCLIFSEIILGMFAADLVERVSAVSVGAGWSRRVGSN